MLLNFRGTANEAGGPSGSIFGKHQQPRATPEVPTTPVN
jgi:hypothetical protein